MTTIIAVRQGKKVILASDSQATGGGTPFTVNKIYQVGGYTFAAAGSLSSAQKTARNLKPKGKKSKRKKPTIERFVKLMDDDCYAEYVVAFKKRLYSVGGDGSIVEMGDGEPLGIGSGSAHAIGALCAGASPSEAIEIAAAFDVFSGGEIIEMTL